MKKIGILLLSFLISLVSKAQSEDVIYLYLNNGDFNAFFCSDIDSITQSKADLQGKIHDDWNTQLIYTKDSIYRYQISAIDSISFHEPAVVYKPEVILMDGEWIPYVTITDTMTIVVSDNTHGLSAKVGDVLMTDVNEGDTENCFVGRVSEIRKKGIATEYICKSVELKDIYQQFVTIGHVSIVPKGTYANTRADDNQSVRKICREHETVHNSFDLGENLKLSWDHTPKLEIEYIVKCVDGKSIVKTRYVNSSENDINFSIKKEFIKDKDGKPFEKKSRKIKIFQVFIPYTPLCVFLDACLFVDLNASISGGLNCSFTMASTDETESIDGKLSTPKHTSTCDFKAPTVDFAVDGEVFGGDIFYLGLGLGTVPRALGVGVATKVGFTANGNLKFDVSSFEPNTIAYDLLKDNEIAIGAKEEFGIFAEVFGQEVELPEMSIAYEQDFFSRYIVPEFDEINYDVKDREVNLQTRANRDLCFKAQVGLGLFDSENNPVDEIAYYDYDKVSSLPITQKYVVEKNGTYVCRPVVRLMKPLFNSYSSPIWASPSEEIIVGDKDAGSCPDGNHPHMIDLGLPSGIKWSCCNVGASTPSDFGHYYAWGDTNEKEIYDTSTYTLYYRHYQGDRDLININDISGSNYDVAHVLWGSPWKIPTIEQCKELIDNCTYSYYISDDKWGVDGAEFIGPNGNSIFFPQAGCRHGATMYAPNWTIYWISNKSTAINWCAYTMQFTQWQPNVGNDWEREYGIPVRPVAK